MAYPLNTAVWNIGLAAALATGACGCTGRTPGSEGDSGSETGEEGSSASSSSSSSSTTGPECESNSDCAVGYYCTPEGTCEYENWCGVDVPPQRGAVAGPDGKPRCSPPLDCYSDEQCGPGEYCAGYACVPGEAIPECGTGQTMRAIPLPSEALSLSGEDLFAIDIDGDGVDELLITDETAPNPAVVWDINDASVSFPSLQGVTVDMVALPVDAGGVTRVARLTHGATPEQVEVIETATWSVLQTVAAPADATVLALADMYPNEGAELFVAGALETSAFSLAASPAPQLGSFAAGQALLAIDWQGNGAHDLWVQDVNDESRFAVLQQGLDAPTQLAAPLGNTLGTTVAALQDGGPHAVVQGREGAPQTYSTQIGRIRIERGLPDYLVPEVALVANYAVNSNAEPGIVKATSVLSWPGDELLFAGSESLDVVNLDQACLRGFANPFEAQSPLYFGDFDGDGYDDVIGMSASGPAAYSFAAP